MCENFRAKVVRVLDKSPGNVGEESFIHCLYVPNSRPSVGDWLGYISPFLQV